METIVGFLVGYVVGSREGKEGVERLRTSWQSIKTSPEVRRLAGEALSVAEQVTQRTSARGLSAVGGTIARSITERVGGTRQVDSHAA